MSEPISESPLTTAPSEVEAPGPAGAPGAWRLNRRRLRWFIGAFAVVVLSSLWFCWLQPPAPVGPPRPKFPTLGWWWNPVEENAHRRLPLVPSVNLNSCFFTNNLGWVVGDGGVILHTADGGRTWQAQTNVVWGDESAESPAADYDPADYSAKDSNTGDSAKNQAAPNQQRRQKAAPTERAARKANSPVSASRRPRDPQDLNGVRFVDAMNGWAVGYDGTILHTANGGRTWTVQTSNTTERLWSLAFVDAQRGWAVGNGGMILHTANGGQTWVAQTAPTPEQLLSVSFADTQHGWAVGDGGTILHTASGGQTWVAQTAPTPEQLLSVSFADTQYGWAVGRGGTILHTADGGQVWKTQTANTEELLRSVAFADAQHGWAVGSGGTNWHTANGGQTWTVQAANTMEFLKSVVFTDAQRGWAVGNGGTILHTTDGGQTWALQTANMTAELTSVAFADAQRGWAVGTGGMILHTANGGQTWVAQTASSTESLMSVAFADTQHGWAVGDGGTILHTASGGQTWMAQTRYTTNWLFCLAFVDTQRGWVVGDRGSILQTADGGQTWKAQTANTEELLRSVAFADAQHGWAVGSRGTLLHTADGGLTWVDQTAHTAEWFSSVAFVDTQRGWVVGYGGTILHTTNGGQTWAAHTANNRARLWSVAFVDAQRGWAVGDNGTILHTADGGQTWVAQTAHTSARLSSVCFVDAQRIWAVGASGTILRTIDGGITWVDSRQYRRFPAPYFYVFLGLAGLVFWRGVRNPDEMGAAAVQSVADHAVSDRPLTSKDFDALNFGPLAEGIANYLRNEKTTGPLTLAITGKWGSGKSSIMGLLKEKLEAHDFRPVWFNAWHHQQEEQLLAALLESIRLQAVPSWFSLAGLQFRARLIKERLRWKWPLILLAALGFAMLAAVIEKLGGDWKEWRTYFKNAPGVSLLGKGAGLLVLAGVVFKIYEGFKAFGVDPAKLLSSVTDKAKVSVRGLQTSARHQFAQEFKEVTTALQPRTLTVFVDDLDRCDPAQVMQVMQSLNFLATAGECFLVVGMEESAVKHCVKVSLEKQDHYEPNPELWMEKLVQIRIPVPNPDDAQFKALLAGEGDALKFLPGRLKNLASFATKLSTPSDAVSSYLFAERLSEATQRELHSWWDSPERKNRWDRIQQVLEDWRGGSAVPDSLRQALVSDLNSIIEGSAIWEKERFSRVSLRAGLEEYIDKKHEAKDVARQNRLLLEDAYPRELSDRLGWGAWVRTQIAAGWQRLRLWILAVATVALTVAGYWWAGDQIKEPPPPHSPTWPTNSVVSPDTLTGITLEAPDGVTGANLMTNANFTNWVAEKKWAVKLQFEPRTNRTGAADLAPHIVAPPQGQSVTNGADVTFSVTARGAPPLRYQWQFNETDLPAATNAILSLRDAQSDRFGTYRVVVTNGIGAVTSAPPALLALREVVAPPTTTNAFIAVVVQPGQTNQTSWWLPTIGVIGLVALLVLGVWWLFDRLEPQVRDSEDFRDALARWSVRISRKHQTPRSAKRLVNKLRFYSMMMRALQATGARPKVPENALVAFGVLDAEGVISNGQIGLSFTDVAVMGLGPAGHVGPTADDVHDLQTAMKAYPGIFRYLQSAVVDGAASKSAAQG